MNQHRKSSDIRQFAMYVIVGAIATVVEWVMFYLGVNLLGVHYIVATCIAFIVSTLANWGCGRILLFHSEKSLLKELAQIYWVSIIGLLMNLVIMWISVELLGINKMFSKIAATGIVFFWNFLSRKFWIYKS